MNRRRVRVQWTTTAKEGLAALPYKARKGLIAKADGLLEADDPAQLGKPLTGPLAGYYRITYSRYRAIYSVEEDHLSSGDVVLNITVRFIAAGVRKDGDRRDVYQLAMKLIEMGAIDLEEGAEPEEPDREP